MYSSNTMSDLDTNGVLSQVHENLHKRNRGVIWRDGIKDLRNAVIPEMILSFGTGKENKILKKVSVAGTVYRPIIVRDTLMIEQEETQTKTTVEQFIEEHCLKKKSKRQ